MIEHTYLFFWLALASSWMMSSPPLTVPKESAVYLSPLPFNSGAASKQPTSPATFFFLGPIQCPKKQQPPPCTTHQSSSHPSSKPAPTPPPVKSGLYFNHPFFQHLGWMIGLEREGKGCKAVVKYRTLNPKKVCLFSPHLCCTMSPHKFKNEHKVVENHFFSFFYPDGQGL